MPALMPTEFTATIVWLGVVPSDGPGIRSQPSARLALGWHGPEGDRHAGLTRPSCSRMLMQHPRGTEIRNVRQLAIVSAEELAEIARRMALDTVAPEWLGATMVLEGLPDLSHLPPSSRLQAPDGTTLVVDMENRPCNLPAREIAQEHEVAGKRFKAAAEGRRGITAWVERPGEVGLGDVLRLHVPDQRMWAHYEALRS